MDLSKWYFKINQFFSDNRNYICLLLIIFVILYVVRIIIIDRRKAYKISDLKFYPKTKLSTNKTYYCTNYWIFERRKARAINSIKAGTKINDSIILLDKVFTDKYNGAILEQEVFFNYVTTAEWNRRTGNTVNIKQTVKGNSGNVNISNPIGNVTYNIQNWNEEVHSSNLSNEDKLLVLQVLGLINAKKAVQPSLAKRCINILTGMNTMFTFSKTLIGILSKFIN